MNAFKIIAAASILLTSVPAFARGGGGMGGMGHGNTMTATSTQNQSTQPQSTSAGVSKNTNTARNNIFKNIELHIVFEKDLRVEMEIVKLMNEGQGNSARAQALRAEDLKLANQLRKLGFTGS